MLHAATVTGLNHIWNLKQATKSHLFAKQSFKTQTAEHMKSI